MTKNTGREYEEFVQSIYQAIIQSEILGFTEQKNIKVEIDKTLIDRNGIKRQFDIYWEYNLAGHSYKTVIECKDYNSKISIDKIDAFIGKLNDFPGLKGLYATHKGYQSGASIKADQHNIDLLIIREQNDTDWEDENKNPLLREINLKITAIHPARIIDLQITTPKGEDPIDNQSSIRIDQIIIIDEDLNKEYSIYDLQNSLLDDHSNGYGEFEKTFSIRGKVRTPDIEINIVEFKIKYIVVEPSISNIVMDFSKKLLGVVEYLNEGKKSLVFDDHIKKR
ncbi:restriction endonuclease [Acinetobacter pollinis]|uniref:restriction endonuclease n=1 Tax=Acinetobacter pollinis TaxID=2605270 RepID=UPI0018C1D8F4|nr:restriction endonuclease [Acinetobacter pollinis]MBF7694283.1 restriction endonuclease [Acinetobacter pollinis]MBF7701871.1 restriction endonuclease [Acinetobacter pollinis]